MLENVVELYDEPYDDLEALESVAELVEFDDDDLEDSVTERRRKRRLHRPRGGGYVPRHRTRTGTALSRVGHDVRTLTRNTKVLADRITAESKLRKKSYQQLQQMMLLFTLLGDDLGGDDNLPLILFATMGMGSGNGSMGGNSMLPFILLLTMKD